MKNRLFLLLLVLLLLFSGCAPKQPERHTKQLFAMDTVMELSVYGDASALEEAAALIRSCEASLSATDSSSELYRLNMAGSMELSDETAALLRTCLALREQTAGAFRPDLYRLTKLWGFTTGEYRVPVQEEIDSVLAALAGDTVRLEGNTAVLTGAELDFGAIAKGYVSQQVAQLWRSKGISGILSLGGNVQTVGSKPDGSPWKVGIRSPFDDSSTLGTLTLGETAAVTSGGYQRYFEKDGVRYSHIMDASTGYPAKSGLASVTVLCESGTLADAYSTALYVMGVERAVSFWRETAGFEMILVTDDGNVYATEGLKDCFSCNSFEVISR